MHKKAKLPEEMDTIGFAIGEASRLMRQRFDEYARTYGVTRSQWLVLIALMRQEPVSQVKLASYLEVEPMSLCRMADRLQAVGLLERTPDPDDRRVRLLTLSDKARDLLSTLRAYSGRVQEYIMADFSADEREKLFEQIRVIGERLKDPALDALLATTIANDRAKASH